MIRRMRHWAAMAVAAVVMTVIMSAGLLTAWAADGKIAFSDPSATVGSQVSVRMEVTSSGNLESANVMLAYDPDVLEFVSGTNAEGDAGAIRVRGDGGTPNTKMLAFTLKFNARTVGTGKITVTSQEVYDSGSQLVTVAPVGTSTVTVGALRTAAKDASLQSLQVSPGTLTPQFSPDVDTYSVTVGTDVEKLIVTAKTSDENANSVVSGSEELQMGDNRVTCKVTAQDGETVKEYVIVVTKKEGGPSAEETDLVTGVKIKIAKREITVIEPDESVKIPDGFKENPIRIDNDTRVQGWVWMGESGDQFGIIYGMNEAGEKNFYRYDLKESERTIQRYIQDPAVQKSRDEYNQLDANYNQLDANYNQLAAIYDKLCEDYKLFQMLLIVAILIAVGLLILLLVVVLKKKDNGPGGSGDEASGKVRGKGGQENQRLEIAGDEDEYGNKDRYEDEYQDEYGEEGYGDDACGDPEEYDGSGDPEGLKDEYQDDSYYNRRESDYQRDCEPEENEERVRADKARSGSRQPVPEYQDIPRKQTPAGAAQNRIPDEPQRKRPEPSGGKVPEPEEDSDDFEIFDL